MRELFFESAAELLQTLNEVGLELEKHPEDAEILRQARRTVHTLKGDSAACGYQEMSELAHLLEDALTPGAAAIAKSSLADVVLMAADTFSSMISAYRGNIQAPDGEELIEQIQALTRKPASSVAYKLQARFEWSEYEELTVAAALERGEYAFNVAFSIDPQCPMRVAALQLIRNVLAECGQVLAIVPDEGSLAQDIDVVEALICTTKSREWIERKCRIPSVVSDLLLEEAGQPNDSLVLHDEAENDALQADAKAAEPAADSEG